MTHHTFFLQHRRNGVGVANLFVGFVLLGKVNKAANGVALGQATGSPASTAFIASAAKCSDASFFWRS